MKTILRFVLALSLLPLSGCGSGSNSPNLFVGTWTGHVTGTEDPTKVADFTLTIEPDGHALGTATIPNSFPMGFGLNGTVSPSGQADFYFIGGVPNPPPEPTKATGKFYINQGDRMFATLTLTQSGTPYAGLAISVTKQ